MSSPLRLLVLGRGKTGSLVAEAARARGHAVTSLGSAENPGGEALTAALLAEHDAVIDFTTPEAVVKNLEAALPQAARIVVGTTGWYTQLPQLAALAEQHGAALLHGTNFSLGVQAFFRAARTLAEALPHASFAITEVHHASKRDAPSGTALTLQHVVQGAAPGAEAPITSRREGDVPGLHLLSLTTPDDHLILQHEAGSRRGFAEGAVRAAEWLAAAAPGVYNFADVAPDLQ